MHLGPEGFVLQRNYKLVCVIIIHYCGLNFLGYIQGVKLAHVSLATLHGCQFSL